MKAYAINGSPRKKWNTAILLDKVIEGVRGVVPDAEAQRVNLYDLEYKGCVSCFACKRIGGPSYGRCAVRDGIWPLLQDSLEADILVFGTPIYFGAMTGMMRCFLERLYFPVFAYDQSHSSIAPRKLRTAFIYDMNVTREQMLAMHYPEALASMENFAGHIFGNKPHTQFVNDTLQFDDYSKYLSSLFDPKAKTRWRETQFPHDCEAACELGRALAQEAMQKPE